MSDNSYIATTNDASANTTELVQTNLMSFVPMLLIFAVFYFFLIRPQEKKRQQHEQMVDSVQKGEDIVTHGGIYGRVEKINANDGSIELEITKNVTIKIAKSAIAEIVSRKK